MDRTLLRENLRLTVEERLLRLQDALRLVDGAAECVRPRREVAGRLEERDRQP